MPIVFQFAIAFEHLFRETKRCCIVLDIYMANSFDIRHYTKGIIDSILGMAEHIVSKADITAAKCFVHESN